LHQTYIYDLINITSRYSLAFIDKDAPARHFSGHPLALVDSSIRKSVLAVAVLQSVLELSDVELAGLAVLVEVGRLARPVHFVVLPHAFVLVVLALLNTETAGNVRLENPLETALYLPSRSDSQVGLQLTVVVEAVAKEDDDSLALLQALVEGAFEDGAVRVGLLSQSLLGADLPLALVDPLAVGTVELAVSMRLILVPFSLVVAAVAVEHEAESLPTAVDPIADVIKSFCFVDHDSQSVAHLAFLPYKHAFFLELRHACP
jgi:hypothetical protein